MFSEERLFWDGARPGERLCDALRPPADLVTVTVGDHLRRQRRHTAVRNRFVTPMTAATRHAAAQVPGVRVVDLHPVFRGHASRRPVALRWVQARDGRHPTLRGQRAIAQPILDELASG